MTDKYDVLPSFDNLSDLMVIYCSSYSCEITMSDFFGICLLCNNYYKSRIICYYERYTKFIVLFAHYAVNDED